MAKFADRVKVGNTTAANAGSATTLTLGSAEAGYQAVPSSLNGETIRYVIEEGNTWEIGTGTYTHSGTTLTRSVTSSSNSNNAIAVTTNSKVFISPAAEDIYPINTVLVTVSAGKFVVDGTSQQALSLMQSITYRFDQSDSTNSSHPLKFSTTSDGTHNSGSEYTTGVTVVGTAGSAGAYVEIKLEQDAPSTLYYYCGNHSGMGGSITVGAASSGIALTDLSVTQNAASGTGTLSYNNSSGVFSYTPPAETSASGGILEPIKETEIIASNNQTSFPVSYAVGNIAVFLNGSKLGAADFTATNGTTVVLATGATANDLVEVVEYGAPFAAPYKSSIYTANGSSPFNTGNTILTAAYTQGKEGVYVNGVKLLSGTDYTTNTGGTTITFTSALSTNDKVELVEHGALSTLQAFTDLTDTPSALGTAGQLVQVNSGANALEFAANTGITTGKSIAMAMIFGG